MREEIKSACEYRPFEKCDYSPRLASEISCKKLEHVLAQLDSMKEIAEQFQDMLSSNLVYYFSLVILL